MKDTLIDLLDLAESLQMAKLTASAARDLFAVDPESERAAKAIEALIADWQATEKALAAKAAGPLPGGYAVGEKVFFALGERDGAHGDKVTHGQAGEVKGTATNASVAGKGVDVMFPGNKGNIACFLTKLSRTPPPPLPGGYAVGEKVYFTGRQPDARERRQAHARPGGRGDGAPGERQPRLRQGRGRDVPGEQGQHQLLPHHAQPHAAAAAAGRVRRRREGLLHRGQPDGRERQQVHPRPGGRGDGAPEGDNAPLRQGRDRDVPGEQGQHHLLPHRPQHAPTAAAAGLYDLPATRSARRDEPDGGWRRQGGTRSGRRGGWATAERRLRLRQSSCR